MSQIKYLRRALHSRPGDKVLRERLTQAIKHRRQQRQQVQKTPELTIAQACAKALVPTFLEIIDLVDRFRAQRKPQLPAPDMSCEGRVRWSRWPQVIGAVRECIEDFEFDVTIQKPAAGGAVARYLEEKGWPLKEGDEVPFSAIIYWLEENEASKLIISAVTWQLIDERTKRMCRDYVEGDFEPKPRREPPIPAKKLLIPTKLLVQVMLNDLMADKVDPIYRMLV